MRITGGLSAKEAEKAKSEPRETTRRDRKTPAASCKQHLSSGPKAFGCKHLAFESGTADLANNNSVSAQVWVIEPLPPGKGPGANLANNNVLAFSGCFCRITETGMLTSEQINDLHRMYWSEHCSIRKIERHLNMGWRTIKKYLEAPAQGPATRQRTSKLDAFKPVIAEWLEKDPRVTAAVIENGCDR